MAQISLPWEGIVTGDAGPYSDADWQNLYRYLSMYDSNSLSGVLAGSAPGVATFPLWVSESSPAAKSVTVRIGAAVAHGVFYQNEEERVLAIGDNNSGNPRIDMVILRVTYATQEVRLFVLQGTPAGSPARPVLTTSAAIWEIPLALVNVANGFSAISDADIENISLYGNIPPALFHENVVNNSGGELKSGDVVVWDLTMDRAVTTTVVANNDDVAGIWQGVTANGGRGRVQYEGIGYVLANGAVTRGNLLVTSATAKQAKVIATDTEGEAFARALESTAGAGPVLCNIGHYQKTARINSGVVLTRSSGQVVPSGIETAVSWTTAVQVGDVYYSAANPTRITFPRDGVYLVHCRTSFTIEEDHEQIWYLNGTTTRVFWFNGTGQDDIANEPGVTIMREFAAGDYLEFVVYQLIGADRTLIHIDLTTYGMSSASANLLWET